MDVHELIEQHERDLAAVTAQRDALLAAATKMHDAMELDVYSFKAKYNHPAQAEQDTHIAMAWLDLRAAISAAERKTS